MRKGASGWRAVRRGTLLLVGALLLVAALGRVSWVALEGEEIVWRQRIDAAEKDVLLRAIARADAVVAIALAREAARPRTDWQTFRAAPRESAPGAGAGPLASPLLSARPALFPLHFRVASDGTLSSPTVPAPGERALALARGLDEDTLRASADELRALAPHTVSGQLARSLERLRLGRDGLAQPTSGELVYGNRLLALTSGDDAEKATGGPFVPLLLDREDGPARVAFVRNVRLPEGDALHGMLADHASLERLLLEHVRDLMPEARFRTAEHGEASNGRLGTIPFVLEPGPRPAYARPLVTPTRVALGGMWGALLVAVAATAFAWRKTALLAERRRVFVSAVTHELRTPLTTFCLYTQMLASGMVGDEERRRQYLRTLEQEAERLRRIVESVLAYARLDARPRPPRPVPVDLGALVERVRPPLERRASEAGMELVLEGTLRGLRVRADAEGVERVLYNLIDNACKYTSGAEDRRIHLEGRVEGRTLVLAVRDHGPGISPEDREAVFEPFRRGEGGVGPRAPGAGLGLALAREVARGMGGEVEVRPLAASQGPGAQLELRLHASRHVGFTRRGPSTGGSRAMLDGRTRRSGDEPSAGAAERPDGAPPCPRSRESA